MLVAAAAALARAAEPRHIASATDGCGWVSTNAVILGGESRRHAGAGAQAAGVTVAAAGGFTNCAGFLHAERVMRPELDTDGDGLPDELDSDNDADGLPDRAELDGTAFRGATATDPCAADSDGDGMDDGAESAGMYDPWDAAHALRVLGATIANGVLEVRWVGKGGGYTNTVQCATTLGADAFAVALHSGAFPGGSPPWHKATNTWSGPVPADPRLFLRLRTDP